MKYSNPVIQEDLASIAERDIRWEDLRNRTILITGATGMLASYHLYVLMYLNQHKGYQIRIIALVRNEKKARTRFADILDSPLLKLLVQDVCDPIRLMENVDYILHAAGNASPKHILSDPVGIIKANTLGTVNVLDFASAQKVRRVLYTSTREIYGKMPAEKEEIFETDSGEVNCKELRACYPESKRIAETLLVSYSYQYGVPFQIVRLAHVYGPGMELNQDGRVMADFISDMVHNRDIVLKSDGSALRAFCYISDAVAGIFTALLNGDEGEAYNIANETEPVMIREAAQELVNLFPERNRQVIADIPQKQSEGYSRMGRAKLNTAKLEHLGWSCRIRLKDGMYRTVMSFWHESWETDNVARLGNRTKDRNSLP